MLKNRVLSCLLALCMLCPLLPMSVLAAEDGGDAPASRTGQTISVDTAWDQETTLAENLIVENGVTLTINAKVTISGNVTISGGGTIMRGEGYTDHLIVVPANAVLTIENITIDGGAKFGTAYDAQYDVDETSFSTLGYSLKNAGMQNCDCLIYVPASGALVINSGAVLRNNDRTSGDPTAGNPVGSAVRSSGTLKMTGGMITRCYGGAGAIFSEGTFEMTGGEICYNAGFRAVGNGYTGGGLRTKNATLSGGKIHHNVSRFGAGIEVEGMLTIQDEFQLTDNYAVAAGGGIGVPWDGGSVIMTGGEISGNRIGGESIKWGSSYTSHGAGISGAHYNFTMTGGIIRDNISPDTKGSVDVLHARKEFLIGGNAVVGNGKTGGIGSWFSGELAFSVGEKLTGTVNIHIDKNPKMKTGDTVVSASSGYILTPSDLERISLDSDDFCLFLANDNNIKAAKVQLNGGKFQSYSVSDAAVLPTPIREGSIFAGWYDNEDYIGEAVPTPTAGKTYYAKWTGIEPLTLEYTRTEQLKVTDVTELTNWRSSDTTVATVDESGNVTAVGVGTATISATGTYNDQAQTFTTTVTVTPLPITFGTDDDENPNGRITYARASIAPEFSQFAKFYPAKVENDNVSVVEGSNPITLTRSTDITFEYDAGGGKATYNFLPLYVTDDEGVEVTVRLINDNYRFVTRSNSTPSDTITETVVVTAENKTKTEITGLPNVDANSSYEYTGVGIAPITDLTEIRAEGIDSFTVHFHRWGDTVFPPQHLENKSASELTQTAIQEIAPKEPGSYLMILDGVSDSKYGHQSWIFTIEKGTPEGEPTFEKASSGVTLSTVTLSGEMKNAAGTEVAGMFSWNDGSVTVTRGTAYSWTFTPTDSNYYNTVTGTAVVWPAPSGGGSGSSSSNTTTKTVTNADGSVTTTVTDKRTGTVTETTKYKDGSTLVVETKKDGTVTTTETRADGVRVKTVDAPEKDVTVSVTIPKSVGTTTILGRTEAGYGMVAVDAETGKVVKLSVPTEDGLLVKLDGSAELTLVNNAREFSDTNGHWAENAIDFATAHEMFAGTSEITFSPDDTMTRAMLMTVLARFDGEDTAGGSVWYEKGMAWAVANGVSDGSYPENSISREQLATMLWRYAGSPTVSGMALSEFSDHDSVSGYAADAMRWAVSEGLIVGVEHDVLAPLSTATRAQVATILMRFVEMLTK